MTRKMTLAAMAGLLAATTAPGRADSITIESSRDNSIYSDSDALSNGSGQYLFAGRIRSGTLRRALIRFDVADALPAEAMPTSVTLTLYCTRSVSADVPVALHRLSADWGEAASDAEFEEGLGADAQPGDATWGYRFFQTDPWATAGGDFAPSPSATAPVGFAQAAYSWSSDQMLADVEAWRAEPNQNFGWIVVGDETAAGTAKRFASRENPDVDLRPKLTIEYEVIPLPCLGDLDGNNTVDITDLAILLSSFGGGAGPADLDSDGDVDITDLSTLLSRFGVTC
ncbi:MAG: DNRLRE domain-containing protein [Phycisphaerales bacterium]|nr:DNRLRE domain-containing protein [Phycisphaerales bacterium]